MPDPLPPTVVIEHRALLVDGKVFGPDETGRIFAPANAKSIEGLYKRDDIAPLKVPLVDQHNNVMGHENRKARELLIERVWTDKDGVVWSRPTAFAYAAVCEARHQWEMTAGDARALLAALVDAVNGNDPHEQLAALDNATAFLNRRPMEPTE